MTVLGIGFLRETLLVNGTEIKSQLLQAYDEIVTIWKTLLSPSKQFYQEMRKRLKFSASMS
jgi:hypothetical protein